MFLVNLNGLGARSNGFISSTSATYPFVISKKTAKQKDFLRAYEYFKMWPICCKRQRKFLTVQTNFCLQFNSYHDTNIRKIATPTNIDKPWKFNNKHRYTVLVCYGKPNIFLRLVSMRASNGSACTMRTFSGWRTRGSYPEPLALNKDILILAFRFSVLRKQ